MAFEPHMLTFAAEAGLPELTCHPDYEVILDTGEIEFYEAKYSRDGLRDAEREKLALTAAHFAAAGDPLQGDLPRRSRNSTASSTRSSCSGATG